MFNSRIHNVNSLFYKFIFQIHLYHFKMAKNVFVQPTKKSLIETNLIKICTFSRNTQFMGF